MYEIEKNVPRPQRVECKYPFEKMDIGDSFLIPAKERNSVRSSAINYSDTTKRRDGTAEMKWSICRVDSDFYRVWRIA